MTKVLLLLTLFAGSLAPLIPSASEPYKQLFPGAASGNQQNPIPLTEGQVDAMLKSNNDDQVIAEEIRQNGIDLKVDPTKLEQWAKNQRARPQTQKELLKWETQAAYQEFLREKDLEKRLDIGKAFLQRHPDSLQAANVVPALRKIELELFEAAFNAYSANPNLPGLEEIFKLGSKLLSQYSADRATEIKVKVRMALATSKGITGGFYNDLALSQVYAKQAQSLLEDPIPPPDFEPQSYSQLRANSLGLIYQSLGHYLLRQSAPEPEQAIVFLTKAAESKEAVSANDPFTYFLRASARDLIVKRLNEEYLSLPKAQRTGRKGRSICSSIGELVNQMSLDYSQTLYLCGLNNSPQLKEDATNAHLKLEGTDRPCLGGRSGPIAEWPSEEKRYALVIGVEDYIDKRVVKFNDAASDAHDVAEVLVRYGGFRKEQVLLLATGANQSEDSQPIRSNILQQLGELPNHVQQDGLLLIYFVGHAFEKAGKTYLLAKDSHTDTESQLSDSAINLDRFREEIKKSGAGQVMLIFDSFQRTPASEAFSRQLSFDVRKNEMAAYATFLSASPGQRSHDSPAKKHGHFTSLFLEAAKGKAANKNRDVTLENLINYLRTNVPKQAKLESASAIQEPWFRTDSYNEESLVIFSSDESGQPAPQRIDSKATGVAQTTNSKVTGVAQTTNSNLDELARSSDMIYIRSKTIYLNKALLETELSKLPEFQASKLKIVSDDKEADLVVEVTLPVLTWMWNYNVIHRTSNKSLFSGRLRGLTADSVSPRLSKEMMTKLRALRESTSPQK